MLYNFTDRDHSLEGKKNGVDKLLPRFCDSKTLFTFARVVTGFPLGELECPIREITLEPLSKLKPEVVETGLKGEWSNDHPPIPLFQPTEPEIEETTDHNKKDTT